MRQSPLRLIDLQVRSAMVTAAQRAGATLVGDISAPDAVRVLVARGEHTVDLRMNRTALGAARWCIAARREGAAAELSVRPELAGEGIDKLLGLTLDLDTGDARFDARFVVEAAPAAVLSHLLERDVRAAMLRLPVTDEGPALRVDASAVTLQWDGGVGVDDLAATLHAVFETLARCRALHEAITARDEASPFRALAGGSATVDPSSRDAARARIGRARRKAAAFVATAAMVGVAFLASVFTVNQ